MFKKRVLNSYSIKYIGFDRIIFTVIDMEDKSFTQIYAINKFKELLSKDFKFIKLFDAKDKLKKIYIEDFNIASIKSSFTEEFESLFGAFTLTDFNDIIEGSIFDCRMFFNKQLDEIIILTAISNTKSLINNFLTISNAISVASILDTINLDILKEDSTVYTLDLGEHDKVYIRKDFENKSVNIYNGDELIFAFEFDQIKFIEAKIYKIYNS